MKRATRRLGSGSAAQRRTAHRTGTPKPHDTVRLVNRVVPRRRLAAETSALARRIALLPPVTAALVKESINHAFDLMGKGHSFKYHFMLHQFMHGTQAAQQALAARRRTGSIAAMVRERDRGGSSTGRTPHRPSVRRR